MKKKVPLLPIDIALPQRTPLEDGALFVVLRTLDELESFWQEYRERFPFAVKGVAYGEKPNFLNENEWVFGPSKESVVNAVFRWNQVGIKCEWYDWANDLPGDHAGWFDDRDQLRKAKIERASWTEADEADYQADCLKRTPESYRGWWQLANLPVNMDDSDWFSHWGEEIIDSNLPQEIVVKMLQERTFDDWKSAGAGEIEFHDTLSLDDEVAYWRKEQRDGQGYYGDENET